MAGSGALASGNQAITATSGGNMTLQGISGGSLTANSSGGSISTNGVIDGSTGNVALTANQDVNINNVALNTTSGGTFTATAGNDLNVNSQIDGTNSAAATSGAVTLPPPTASTSTPAAWSRPRTPRSTGGDQRRRSRPGTGLYAGTGAIPWIRRGPSPRVN